MHLVYAPRKIPEISDEALHDLYRRLEGETCGFAMALCEQLRIVLEPTLKGRMQGDYKTGKRISMRKVIAYIASQYRKDKIWLRRVKPSKRQYQVLLAVDNSKSMEECGVSQIAMQALFTLCQALVHVEVGEFGVCAFGGEKPEVLLPLGSSQFTFDQAKPLLQDLQFDRNHQSAHNHGLADLMKMCCEIFSERSAPTATLSQMMLIVTDARCNKDTVRPWVQHALSNRVVPLLIIVDSGKVSISLFFACGSPPILRLIRASRGGGGGKSCSATPKMTRPLKDRALDSFASAKNLVFLTGSRIG